MGTRGPAPSPTALRRSRDRENWRRLPPHGLTTDYDIPEWPTETDAPSTAELALWTRLWRTKPVAWEWLRYGLGDQVALYVRYTLRAGEVVNPSLAGEARRMGTALWLDVESMRRSKMDIDPDISEPINGLDVPEEVREEKAPGTVTRLPSARDRMGGNGKGDKP